MSAVENTPVEIWSEIIHYALCDPAIFRPNPFYPSCNPHTALRVWHDYRHIRKCRPNLRLVARSWKAVVDSHVNWLLESKKMDHLTLAESHWISARRIHLQVVPRICTCVNDCVCMDDDYYVNEANLDAEAMSLNFIPALAALSKLPSPMPVKGLIASPEAWQVITDFLSRENIADIFSQLLSLEVVGGFERSTTRMPAFLKHLQYLNISLRIESHISDPVEFPNLTSLKVRVIDDASWEFVATWMLPKLCHLIIHDASTSDTVTDNILDSYLKRGWPLLESFRLYISGDFVYFPVDIWDSLPKLTYFGCTGILRRGDMQVSQDHPLHTLAILVLDTPWESRRALTEILGYFPNLRVVADSHRWEDIPTKYRTRGCTNPAFSHIHIRPPCHFCIGELSTLCQQNGLRYEDRWGRSWEEVLAGSE